MTTTRPPFLTRYWDKPSNTEGWQDARVGECSIQWRAHDKSYEILCIVNGSPGNGDFAHAMDYFYESCKRDGYSLRIREVWNKRLAKHLIKRGFTYAQGEDMVKTKFE